MAEVNGNENAIPIEERTSTAAVESAVFTFTEQLEGSTVVAVIDVDTLLEIIPIVQGAERSPMLSENLTAPGTFQRVFLFQTGDFKVQLTPVSQPNNIGAAVRTVQVS